MDQHRGSLVGAMMQESDDARVVEILLPDVVSDLHANVSRLHTAAEFVAGCINVLQRDLAKRL